MNYNINKIRFSECVKIVNRCKKNAQPFPRNVDNIHRSTGGQIMGQPLSCIRVAKKDQHGRVRLKEKCGQPVRCKVKDTYRFKGQTRCYPRSSFYGLSVRSAVRRVDTATADGRRWAARIDNFFKRYRSVCNSVICRLPLSRVHTKASTYQQQLKRMGVKIKFLGYNEEDSDGASLGCYYMLNVFDTKSKYRYQLTLARTSGSCSLRFKPADFLLDGFLRFIAQDRRVLKTSRRR